MIPSWNELSDQERRALEGMASTFGIDMTLSREMISETLALPTSDESHAVAIEMYMMSRHVILQREEATREESQ